MKCSFTKVFLLIICFSFSMIQNVKAEDIYPEENTCTDSFYLSHKSECKEDNRTFLTEKEVIRYKNPNSEVELEKLPKGELINIQKTYQTEFENWGLIFWSFNTEGNVQQTSGWVKLSDLEFIYDARAFFYDHKKEIIQDRDSLNFEEKRKNIQNQILVWSYPCSGELVSKLDSKYYPTEVQIQTQPLYQDKAGRYWLMVSGRNYIKNGRWSSCAICLSEPTNRKIAAERIEPYTVPDKRGTWNQKVFMLTICGMLLICGVVGLLLVKKFVLPHYRKKD